MAKKCIESAQKKQYVALANVLGLWRVMVAELFGRDGADLATKAVPASPMSHKVSYGSWAIAVVSGRLTRFVPYGNQFARALIAAKAVVTRASFGDVPSPTRQRRQRKAVDNENEHTPKFQRARQPYDAREAARTRSLPGAEVVLYQGRLIHWTCQMLARGLHFRQGTARAFSVLPHREERRARSRTRFARPVPECGFSRSTGRTAVCVGSLQGKQRS